MPLFYNPQNFPYSPLPNDAQVDYNIFRETKQGHPENNIEAFTFRVA